jgi:hypothetical protein
MEINKINKLNTLNTLINTEQPTPCACYINSPTQDEVPFMMSPSCLTTSIPNDITFKFDDVDDIDVYNEPVKIIESGFNSFNISNSSNELSSDSLNDSNNFDKLDELNKFDYFNDSVDSADSDDQNDKSKKMNDTFESIDNMLSSMIRMKISDTIRRKYGTYCEYNQPELFKSYVEQEFKRTMERNKYKYDQYNSESD